MLHLKYLGMKTEKLQMIHEWLRDEICGSEKDEVKRERNMQKLMAFAEKKFNTKINAMY